MANESSTAAEGIPGAGDSYDSQGSSEGASSSTTFTSSTSSPPNSSGVKNETTNNGGGSSSLTGGEAKDSSLTVLEVVGIIAGVIHTRALKTVVNRFATGPSSVAVDPTQASCLHPRRTVRRDSLRWGDPLKLILEVAKIARNHHRALKLARRRSPDAFAARLQQLEPQHVIVARRAATELAHALLALQRAEAHRLHLRGGVRLRPVQQEARPAGVDLVKVVLRALAHKRHAGLQLVGRRRHLGRAAGAVKRERARVARVGRRQRRALHARAQHGARVALEGRGVEVRAVAHERGQRARDAVRRGVGAARRVERRRRRVREHERLGHEEGALADERVRAALGGAEHARELDFVRPVGSGVGEQQQRGEGGEGGGGGGDVARHLDGRAVGLGGDGFCFRRLLGAAVCRMEVRALRAARYL
ncbi:hypothetical protein FGB62_285g00 [Gracilaria domingensis]|nr:hypothetical protein FGB62_285g00 [Gracilaria domingensis]